ncbi:differentially expressed in FDCP 8 homolog [Mercenaria mercenaria]|uniref:differentially expressed in FDCP 8 homolog n=1 Tax=Mercenaria mercenaria TaxID=6596 RepID=UPI00234F1DBF|nr:differentially expressed in FDCP 8 homolog [Mercenaria mercenaria]
MLDIKHMIMSSLELSDEIYSSEDEDIIIANMETKSGLPEKGKILRACREQNEHMKVIQSDTAVASVKMSAAIRHAQSLYDSSDSEGEEIMNRLPPPHPTSVTPPGTTSITPPNQTIVNSLKINKTSFDSRSSSVVTVKSKSSSVGSSVATLNGNISSEKISENSGTSSRRHDSVDSETEITNSYRESRFNPFDRDLYIEEDHFDVNQENHMRRTCSDRLKSDSNESSSWTDPSTRGSHTSDDITFADLGLSEDHYSQPEGFFGMSSTEELEMAIETCKEMIITAQPHSDKQKNLVKKLIQLRIKLQELKEGPEPVQEGVKLAVGHKFVLHSGSGSKHYCEKCNAVIWGVLQQWYKCSECGYCSHEKCLNQITRTCAYVKVQEDPIYCLDICPERGLSSQNYRCAECRGPISFKSGFSEPRLCDYSGNFYCELCHWNDNMLIPARVLHNWDFDEWKVCRASKQFLRLMENKAVIRIQDINPMLFSFVEELNEVKKLREELLIMKRYILLCSLAMKSKLLLQLKNRQHFVENSDIYSMKDLIDIQKDTLLPELAQVHSSWAQHIKTDCEVNRGSLIF